MSGARIVIDQPTAPGPLPDGEPGVSRRDLVLGHAVELSNENNAGIRSWRWRIVNQPFGSVARLSNPIDPGPSFVPDVEGTYLIELQVDEGRKGQVARILAAVLTDFGGALAVPVRIPSAFEDDEANWNYQLGATATPNDQGWWPDIWEIIRSSMNLSIAAANGVDRVAATVPDLKALGSADGVAVGDVAKLTQTANEWVCETVPTANSSTWRPANGKWNLRDYGALTNNVVADTAAFEQIVADATGPVQIPAGQFRVQLSTSIVVSSSLAIEGDSDDSHLDFSGTSVDAFDVRAEVTLRNVRVTAWSALTDHHKFLNLTEATSKVPLVALDGCTFEQAPDGFVVFSDRTTSGGADTQGLDRLRITDCEFSTLAFGVKLDTYRINDATVTGCRFEDIEENGVWLGRDFAASLADFEGQGDYVIADNIFRRIGDGSVQTSSDRHAVILFGKRATITGNTVDHVENNTGNDCEGIYTKATEVVIANNSLHDAGLGQAMITQKGLPRADAQTPGYNTIISGNVLRASAGAGAASAMSIGVGECIIEGNIIDGMTDTAVVVGAGDGDILDVTFRGNRVVNTKSNIALSFNCPGSRAIRITDNVIDGIDGAGGSGNAVGLQVINSGTLAYELVEVRNNVFRGIVSAGATHETGILDNMTQNPSVETFDIIGNKFQSSEHAMKFVAASPRHLRLRIFENDMTDCTEASGDYVSGVGNLLTTRTRFKDNPGFLSESSGQETFGGASSSVTVTHGLKWTRRLDRRITVVPQTNVGNIWITGAGTTQFTINVSTTPSGGVPIRWIVHPHTEVFS